MAKFHEKAIILYGVSQIAENIPAIIGGLHTGTITVALDATAVTGVGTSFDTELAKDDLLYNASGTLIGKIASIASATSLTLASGANVAVSGDTFASDENISAGTITVTTGANTITGSGTSFLTELTPGAYLYTIAGVVVGQIAAVSSDTAATLEANGAVAMTGETYETGLGPKNAIAALNLNYSTELTSEAFQYVGDELSRDEETVITDKYAKFDFETFMPKLGTIAGGDPVESEVPLADWMQSSGMAIVLSTGSGGYAIYTNSVSSNEYMTIEVRRSSPDIATEKTFTMTDCRGVVDLDGQVGTRAKLKFNYNGNLQNVTQKTKLVADFQQQKANTAPSLKSSTVTLSELTPYVTASEPSIVGTTNFCFDKLSAPNVAGFEYDRFLTSCEDGWSKGAVPSDVSLTIIEDEAGAIYNPDNELEKDNVLTVRYGAATGEKVELTFHKLQLANVANSTVAKYSGQDLSYRNVGTTDIKIS